MKTHICVLALVLIAMSSFKIQASAWPNLQYISQSFFEVGLGTEHGISPNLNLRKWNKPIKIYVEHKIGDKALHDQLLDAHIKQLVNITNFDISRVDNKSQANVFYYFTKQSELKSLVQRDLGNSAIEYLHGAICLASVKANKKNHITSAHIFIPVDQARMHGKLVACIVEELTQALGLIRDSDLVFPSIFNDKTRNALLTGLDEILLRLLSESEIKAGMSQVQLAPIVLQLLKKYEKQGLISTAEERVQSGELYEMLGFKRKRPNKKSLAVRRTKPTLENRPSISQSANKP